MTSTTGMTTPQAVQADFSRGNWRDLRLIAVFFLPVYASRGTVSNMEKHFSPQTEQYLANAVASGMFPSKEAAIDAAVEALREKTEPVPMVAEEHMERVERALESLNAGKGVPMTDADWAALHQRARDVAARSGVHGA